MCSAIEKAAAASVEAQNDTFRAHLEAIAATVRPAKAQAKRKGIAGRHGDRAASYQFVARTSNSSNQHTSPCPPWPL